MPHSVAGQIALITGGGRGIGRATAEMLAAAGASVAVSARSSHQVHATTEALQALGADAIGIVADVAVADDVRRLVDQVIEVFGTVDILVNNAGTLAPIGMAWEVDPDEWAYNIGTNLVGAYRLCHAVVPLMIEEGGGRIINVSTGAARRVNPGWSAYAAAKAGLDQFTRVLAAEVAPHGICVNAIYPGVTDTRMQADIRTLSPEQFPNVDRYRQLHAEGRLRDPREPAELIFWLCTSAAQDVTGEVFDINEASVRERVARDLNRPLLPGPER
ncbi:MAG: SDR family oxidoreductase [Anaerolineae bacterium]